MPLNDAYAELKGKAAEGRARTGGTDRKERRAIKLASCPCAAIFVHVSAKDGRKKVLSSLPVVEDAPSPDR